MKPFVSKPLVRALAACGLATSWLVWAQNTQPTGAATPATSPATAVSGAPLAPGAAPAGQPPAPVEVMKVTLSAVLEDVSATGTVKANESVMVRPEIAGRIAKINFRDGDSVCRGQVLMELDASLQVAERDQIQAELNLAISNFKRNEDLASKNFVSPRVKEEAEAQVKVAQAKLALAEARFQRALVRAPFNGVLGLRNVSVGEYVKDGADIVTLDDVSRLRVDFKLPERYAGQAKVGMKVFIEPDAALKLRGLAGKVDSIDTVLDTNGRALTLRTRIPNPRSILKPGMFVKTKLVLSERAGAVMIPDETVTAQGRDMIVYKVADGKAVRTVVKTGARQQGKIEITEGLVAGDVIIQAGLQRINRDGQPVRVVEPRGPGAKPGEGKPSEGKPGEARPGPGGKPAEGKPQDAKGAAGKASDKPGAKLGAKPAERPANPCPPDSRDDARGAGQAGQGGQGAQSGQGGAQAGQRGPRKP
jgi:membrane fusion protein, multidrug efflux system